MTRDITPPGLCTRLGLMLAVVGLTSSLALAQTSAPPASPAKAAAAAQPAPPARPQAAARPATRAVPSRNVKLAVIVTPVSGTVLGTPRVLTVTTADGRYAQVRRQVHPGSDFFLLDVTAIIVNDREVLVEFKLNANTIELAEGKANFGIAQEGAVLVTPGVTQRVTQIDDSGGRPNLHVDMQVEILR
jgi:hypothetical protein